MTYPLDQQTSPPHPPSRRAFSLVELVYVTAIVAITSAIILPHWSNSVRNYQLSLAARRIAADLAWAQSHANAISTSVTVTFDLQNSRYQLSVQDPDRASQLYSVDLTADPYHVTFAPPNSTATSTSVTFNGFGIPSQSTTLVVSSGPSQLTLTLDPSTGQTTIQ